jgi:4-hydroxybenzoate polyprenyltransferase
MVWNDYFDLEEDKRDRPFRPLPSGQVSMRTSVIVALALTAVGLGAATLSGFVAAHRDWHGAAIGGILVVAIILYDARLKRTPVGPLAMGTCRFLNVLLGLTLAPETMPWELQLHVAAAVGVYIVGVTWFARTEAKVSEVSSLRAAALVMVGALVAVLAVPVRLEPDTASPLYPYLLIVFGFVLGYPVTKAIDKPTPERVQAAVKRAVLGLIALDAILATAFVGTLGLLVLLLLPPALVIGKWVYST